MVDRHSCNCCPSVGWSEARPSGPGTVASDHCGQMDFFGLLSMIAQGVSLLFEFLLRLVAFLTGSAVLVCVQIPRSASTSGSSCLCGRFRCYHPHRRHAIVFLTSILQCCVCFVGIVYTALSSGIVGHLDHDFLFLCLIRVYESCR